MDEQAPSEVDSRDLRDRILREATRLFAKKGYNGVSVREIVEAVGTTKPSLYYYFANKENLFERIVRDSLEQYRARLQSVLARGLPIREKLVAMAEENFSYARENADLSRLTYSVYFSSERNVVDFDLDAFFMSTFALIHDEIETAMQAGALRDGDPWLMTLSFVGILNLFTMAILYNPTIVPGNHLAESLIEQFLHGAAGSAPSSENENA